MIQDDLHPCPAVGAARAQHANGVLELAERHHVADERSQPDLPALHERNGGRIILALRHARADERELLEVQVVERQRAFLRRDDAEQQQATAGARHVHARGDRWKEARRFDDGIGAAAVGELPDALQGSLSTGNREVSPERLRERPLVGAAGDPDHGIRAARLRQLHVQLAGHAEAVDDDGLAGKDVDLPLRVQAGREHLDERSVAAVDRVRERKHVARRRGDVVREAAVGVAADQHAFRTQVGLADSAVKARAAVQLRVHDDAGAASEPPGARFRDFAGHLVPHHARVPDRNRAAVDLVVGPADAAVRHLHQDVALVGARHRQFAGLERHGRPEDHGPHGRCAPSSKFKVESSK